MGKVFGNPYLYCYVQVLNHHHWKVGKGNLGMWALRMGLI